MANQQMESMVKKLNQELRAEHDDAVAHRESTRIIKVLEFMIRMTNSAEDNAALDAAKEEAAQPVPTHEQLLAMFKAGQIG